MKWYWAVIIYLAGNIAFIVTLLIMYKTTDNYEKQKGNKKHVQKRKH